MLTENTTKLCSRCSPAQHHSTNDHNGVCVCDCVYVTMHVFVCSRVTSAPSPSLFAVTWSLRSCWTRFHRKHAVFWLPHYGVCVCLGNGGAVTVVVHVCFSFFFSPLLIHTPCILQFLCWLIQQHVFIRCPLLTHLNQFHWCFVRMCLGL